MHYKIITADSVHTLETLVNEAINVGWKPQGGVSADAGYRLVMQAMVH